MLCAAHTKSQINYLFRMVQYVRQNEETSCLKIVHFVGDSDKMDAPAEMEANAKSTSLCLSP